MSKRVSPRVRAEVHLTRKQISRREREQRMRRQLIVGTAAVLALVVLILAWGIFDQYVYRPSQPVVTVAGSPVRLDTYQRLVRYRRWDYGNYVSRLQDQKSQLQSGNEDQPFLLQYIDQQIQQVQMQTANLPLSVVDELIDDQLVRQEAVRRGISVSEEDVQVQFETQFGYDRNPPTPTPAVITATTPITATPAPTQEPMTKEQFDQQSGQYLQLVRQATGFAEKDLRKLVEGSLYRDRLQKAIATEAPTTGLQVHARHLLVETREEADTALARLQAGEDFATLTSELSQDTGSKEEGGDLGWFPMGQMTPEFEEVAFALQPGQTSQVVTSTYGFHIIRVEERDDSRPLETGALEQAQQKAFEDWLTLQRTTQTIVRNWSSKSVPEDLPQRSTQR